MLLCEVVPLVPAGVSGNLSANGGLSVALDSQDPAELVTKTS